MTTAAAMEADHDNKQKIQKAKGGKKFVSKAREFIHTREGLKSVIKYLISESIHLKEQGIIQRIPTELTALVALPFPFVYHGQSCYKKKLDEYSYAVADALISEWEKTATPAELKQLKHNQTLKGATDAERAEIMKAYYVYDHFLTISPDEAGRLTEPQQVKLLLAMRVEFTKLFTREKEDNYPTFPVPHIKIEDGVYKSHLHIPMLSKSYDGKNLDLNNTKLRMFWALVHLENSPQFNQYLDKTNTLAAQERFIPPSEKEYKAFQSMMRKVFKSPSPEAQKKAMAEHNVSIIANPNPESGKDALLVKWGDKTYNLKYCAGTGKFGKQELTRATNLYHQANQSASAKLQMADVVEILKNPDHQSFTDLNAALEAHNVYLIPNLTKTGTVQGFTVYLADTDTQVSMSKLGISFKKELPIDLNDPATIDAIRAVYETNRHLISKTTRKDSGLVPEPDIELSGTQWKKAFSYKKKFMYDYDGIPEYMADNGGQFGITLKNYLTFDRGVFYDKRFNRQAIVVKEYTSDTLKTSLTSESPAAARALAQMYLENGYSTVVITSQGTTRKAQNIWREASMLGLKVEGYTPTPDDEQWLKIELQKKALAVRETNQRAITAYKSAGHTFDIKTVSNQWKSVDRSPIAFAFVDLLKAGLDPLMVNDPPKKSKHKALPADPDTKEPAELTTMYHQILELVKLECPTRLEQAQKALDRFKPLDVLQEEAAKAKPVVVVAPTPVEPVTPPAPPAVAQTPTPPATPAPVKPETEADIVKRNLDEIRARERAEQERKAQADELKASKPKTK
ncbi:hypothetical protein [Pseudomonas haemolytica]|jgi:hypothetical protein|uniref:Uncharacterized protein n=1 Tax=Pseudomonas haemolytica TaxID=2600065 RepID=A0ABS1H0A7_9PSED|nr:hypothetical protein [Pseudomonas haemolytica]MBK3462644.1 hypothetical protein [Pseudomonas haemolytica]